MYMYLILVLFYILVIMYMYIQCLHNVHVFVLCNLAVCVTQTEHPQNVTNHTEVNICAVTCAIINLWSYPLDYSEPTSSPHDKNISP